jgi:Flp pilus assembly protein TadD
LGRTDEAIPRLLKAAKIAPSYPEIYLDLGHAYEVAGEFEKARNSYRKVTKLAPDSALARKAINASRNLPE